MKSGGLYTAFSGKSETDHVHTDVYSAVDHLHDDRYYTEDEVDEARREAGGANV